MAPSAFLISVAAEMLPQLLASGAVEEIDAATYRAAVNRE